MDRIRSGVSVLVAIVGTSALVSCGIRPAEIAPATAPPVASKAPGSQWPDPDGRPHQPLATGGHPATVLLFIATECPISNGYAPELKRIAEAYAPRGVAFYGVHSDADLPPKQAEQHAREFGYPFPVLLDPKQALAQRVGATVTPEAAVLDRNGAVQYRGRVDDLYYGFGKRRHAATSHELRAALDSVLAGRPVAQKSVAPIGCEIAPLP